MLVDRLLADLTADDAGLWRRALGTSATAHGWMPPADIYETEDQYVIELDVPGLDADQLALEVVDGQLVVSGERERRGEVKRAFSQERWHGRFARAFRIGDGFRGEDIAADYHDGVLLVRIAKPEESKPKRIAIAGADRQLPA